MTHTCRTSRDAGPAANMAALAASAAPDAADPGREEVDADDTAKSLMLSWRLLRRDRDVFFSWKTETYWGKKFRHPCHCFFMLCTLHRSNAPA